MTGEYAMTIVVCLGMAVLWGLVVYGVGSDR